MLSDNMKNKITKKIKEFPEKRSALLPALMEVVSQNRYISKDDLKDISALLSLPLSEIYGVASFYHMLMIKPSGKFHIRLCVNISCSLLGAGHILCYLEKHLGISEGEITKDGLFSLECVQCLGACDKAPVMMINDDYYESLDEMKIDRILADIRERQSL